MEQRAGEAAPRTRTSRLSRHLHWLAVAAVGLLALAFARRVDLQPQVTPDFFFGSDDPAFQDTARIRELFPSEQQLIVSAAGTDVLAPEYVEGMTALTTRLEDVEGVLRVRSLTSGPPNPRSALDSPLWSRLLIGDDRMSSLAIAFVDTKNNARLVADVEAIVEDLDAPQFRLHVSGVPYIVEQIRRNLVADLRVFSGMAVLIFSLIVLAVFRSVKLLVGTLTACGGAIMATLLVQTRLGIPIGPLTANLSTIVFILTQSHIIFLTSNWQRIAAADGAPPAQHARRAIRRTVTASFWCMLTTLLGFCSLLFVAAKPLRELGMGGAIGTIAAIAAAYLIYGAFLWTTPPRGGDAGGPSATEGEPPRPRSVHRRAAVVCGLVLVLAVGILRLDTDPSLLQYFDTDSELRRGLEFIDRNGGSSPLQLVIERPDGTRLDNDLAYEQMWDLQRALTEHPAVGTVVSLPVLMAEGERHPLANLLSWRALLGLLSSPLFDRVAANFVTPDRERALFMLRMYEAGPDNRDRVAVIEELQATVRGRGFQPALTGGIYFLQGHLSRLVATSLIIGLAALVVLFGGVAFVVSRSVRTSAAMVGGVALIPLTIFGGLGWLRVPVDIISAPAANVCIGIGIDAMIHLALAVRLQGASGGARGRWARALAEQRRPTLVSAGIVAAGFGIFSLSNFPPTQRFGLAVVVGALVAAVATLIVFPALGGAGGRR